LRFSRSILATAIAVSVTLAGPGLAPATAAVPHTVQPGETLWSIAAASNFTTRTIAAYNGLSEDAPLVAGSTIQIPSEAEGAVALGLSGSDAAPPASAPAAPPPAGAYTVQPGDTLSGIAARSGVAVGQLAWMNGLDPSAPLLIGTGLKLPSSSPVAAPAQPQPEPVTEPDAEPNATAATVTSAQIGQVATQHGVSPSLATAVAWQESGFNNGVISPANARGVMQVLPGTWSWVEQNLAGRALDPNSALDNVSAGTMYLGQLLRDAGGDPALAAAYYYQGEASVRAVGMLPETQHYVANVTALRARFGG
jgi:soluble lytic murein transglycosylase-like protein